MSDEELPTKATSTHLHSHRHDFFLAIVSAWQTFGAPFGLPTQQASIHSVSFGVFCVAVLACPVHALITLRSSSSETSISSDFACSDDLTGLANKRLFDQRRNLSLDRIKIDRSFIRNITSSKDALRQLATMINLGNALGLSVTVEGVETTSQLAKIRKYGRTELQGFLFSKPVPIAEIRRLVDDEVIGVDDLQSPGCAA